MDTKPLVLVLGGILGSLSLPACDLDVPNVNNPDLDQLAKHPTVAGINTAASGLQHSIRTGKQTTTGLVNQLGILGRESYTFDPSEDRFVKQLIQGTLNKSDAFGGVFWAANYANIQLGDIMLRGLDQVADFSDGDKAGIRGFVYTMRALDLLTVIVTHDSTGAVIDTDHPLGSALGAFVSKAAVYTEIARLLDLAVTELASAGKAFTFQLSSGFTGFDTPATFAKFVHALRARAAVYQDPKDYATAKTELEVSFLNDVPASMGFSFNTGVFHVYSTAAGDTQNGLVSKTVFAHPGLLRDVQKQADTTTPDARYTAKVVPLDTMGSSVTSATDSTLTTTIKFKIYTTPSSPIALIRNEELILLKAEALYYTGDKAGGLAELNIVRTGSGKLPPLAAVATDADFLAALLYERRYSLMFEGGHRWIDLRRFGLPLPLDAPTQVQNVRYPVPQAECDARPGEPACLITSSSPAS